MKAKPAEEPRKVKILPGGKINYDIKENYDDQPFIKDKVARANHILKTYGLPKVQGR